MVNFIPLELAQYVSKHIQMIKIESANNPFTNKTHYFTIVIYINNSIIT
jgi:hypothetical protein